MSERLGRLSNEQLAEAVDYLLDDLDDACVLSFGGTDDVGTVSVSCYEIGDWQRATVLEAIGRFVAAVQGEGSQ